MDNHDTLLGEISRHTLTPFDRAAYVHWAYHVSDAGSRAHARRALAADMMPLVIRCARQLTRQGRVLDADFADLVQAGALGAMQAIESWNPEHPSGAKLRTWAAWYIKREMLRENLRAPVVLYASGVESYTEDGGDEDGDFAPEYAYADDDPADFAHHEKISSYLERLCGDELTPSEYRVITGLYFNDLSTREVAASMGVHHTTIGRFHASALGKLRTVVLQNEKKPAII